MMHLKRWNDGLTPRQREAIALLVGGMTQKEAASRVGVNPYTLAHWKDRDENFRLELARACAEHRQRLESRVIANGDHGTAVIQQALKGERVPEQQYDSAKFSVGVAVKALARYKELHVDGPAPPPAPLVVFPGDFRLPWNSPAPALGQGIIDAEAEVVGSDDDSEQDSDQA
jgi:hypothetical protein